MNKVLTLLAAVFLALAPTLFYGCMADDGGTEIPNELHGREFLAGTGKPAADAEVRLIPVGYVPGEDSSDVLFTVRTDAAGNFVFKDPPPGRYNILAAKDHLLSYRDSVNVTGKGQRLAVDTLKAPGSLAGTVKLQPQHDPRTATVQVLGTTLFVNVDADGRFTLPALGAGEYRLRVVTILPNYVPLYRIVTVRAGMADTLAEPLEPFYAGIPVVTGLRAVAGPEGTVVLRWNRSRFPRVQSYLVYRDSAGLLLPSGAPLGGTPDTVYIDTIYSRTPRATQFPYLDSAMHPFRYRIRILDQGDSLGPVFGSVEGQALPPSKKFSSGLWKQATASAAFPKQSGAKAVAFAGRLWLFGSSGSGVGQRELWSSADGADWRKSSVLLPWNDSVYNEFFPVVFQGKLWMMATRINPAIEVVHSLWNSGDGSAWTRVTDSADFPGRGGSTFTVYQDKLWVIDGVEGATVYSKDIRTSADGVTWSRFEPGPLYQATAYAQADTLGGYLWKIGAGSGAINYNSQIWRFSGTGAQMTADTAEFLGRLGHSLISYGKRLWLVGGLETDIRDYSKFAYKNDVWSSEDGETWLLRDSHAPFTERLGHACAVFQDRLWIIGGGDDKALYNDVWYLESP